MAAAARVSHVAECCADCRTITRGDGFLESRSGLFRLGNALFDARRGVGNGQKLPHQPVRSGVVNAGNAFELRATATAQDSTYAGIVRLAEEAGAESAPIVRLADRYADNARSFCPAASAAVPRR